MGYVKHHTIVVTSWSDPHIEAAWGKAREIFARPDPESLHSAQLCSEISPRAMNAYRSFFIAPDGSNEGWGLSDWRDAQRDEFIQWMIDHDDGYCKWVELVMHEDDGEPHITRFGSDAE